MRPVLLRPGPMRVVALTAGVAVAAGAIGFFAATQVKSPADAAAARKPPVASLITVPVERRVLSSTVTTQGTVTHGKPQPITLTGTVAGGGTEGAGAQLVTKTAVAGRTLREGDVLLEINGRPVFVLRGKVPMYRTLTRGSEGDDVRQVRAALRRLLPGRSVAKSGPVDDGVLNALAAWYARKGYQAVKPTVEQRTQLRTLERAVAAAKKAGGQPLADAHADLAEFRRTYGTSVPSGEIVFLPRLPIRLITVATKAGAVPDGPVGTVADPKLVVNATVAIEDAELIKVGMAATLRGSAGDEQAATVTGMGAGFAPEKQTDDKGADGPAGDSAGEPVGTPIQLSPKDAAKAAALTGTSVKVQIGVGRTDGKVLCVPVAALFTGADGQSRVTAVDPTGRKRDVPVEAGLTAGGTVQITPHDGTALKEGDRVVVSGS
ncbi:hypothetical protein AB0J80_03475 [Actinoplanes sp. NPDC049548]|uniref:hypothetical protein n=1 Tax=Actinoplanes sp. NPDC049548 TaxID=3155152 RepID=UPI00343AD47C